LSVCIGCGRDKELRLGFCFDCATEGERKALRRTVGQHLASAATNFLLGRFGNMRFDFKWAYERATRSGDYAPGGYRDRTYPE
jgi:hypothetical protein